MTKLKELRQGARFRLVDIAKQSDISPSRLSLIENEWAQIRKHEYKKLKDTYRKLRINADEALDDLLSTEEAENE